MPDLYREIVTRRGYLRLAEQANDLTRRRRRVVDVLVLAVLLYGAGGAVCYAIAIAIARYIAL